MADLGGVLKHPLKLQNILRALRMPVQTQAQSTVKVTAKATKWSGMGVTETSITIKGKASHFFLYINN